MHILYVHQNFPAQFGHIAARLANQPGWKCTFVSEKPAGISHGIERIQYRPTSGATQHNHFCTRTFETNVGRCHGVYQALRHRPDVKPDLIVGHSGFGSTLFLKELYPNVPIINFFEYYYRTRISESDMHFRSDLGWPIPDSHLHRARCRNAMILLDLDNCEGAYTPTHFQKSCFPREQQPKLEVIFDGIDRSIYHGHDEKFRPPPGSRGTRRIAGVDVKDSTRVVTYVSRGFESMRGFDIFMRSAKRIAQLYPDVLFYVVGDDRTAYGGDAEHIAPATSFKEWVLSRESFDLSKFVFVGRLPPTQLAILLAASDLHIYLTVPFVLSWSMMDAMSCGAVVLGSDTAPVRDMIQHGHNGLLANFFDIEDIAAKAVHVLADPLAARPMGRAAETMVAEHYSLDAVLPAMLGLYERTAQKSG